MPQTKAKKILRSKGFLIINGSIFLLVTLFVAIAITLSKYEDSSISLLRSKADKSVVSTEYIQVLKEHSTIEDMYFSSNPDEVRQLVISEFTSKGWRVETESPRAVYCFNPDPKKIEWVIWERNVKTINNWDSSYSSSVGVKHATRRYDNIRNWFRNYVW